MNENTPATQTTIVSTEVTYSFPWASNFHVTFSNGYILSVLKETQKSWFEIAIMKDGDFISLGDSNNCFDDVRAVDSLDEINEACLKFIPGFVPVAALGTIGIEA